jgi:pimeloyl-ACP methyl ester carboxylesterase
MRRTLKRPAGAFLGSLLPAAVVARSQAKSRTDAIESRFSEIEGIKIHYLTAGHGPVVILLHGYTQTSRMWRPLIQKLADRFRVVAPDLPGIGESDIPQDGLDMKSAALRIHALAKSLGVSQARVVGHDIGLMVAYAYAAQFSREVEKLVVMDAFLPGVPGWELAYDSPNFWHFRFHGLTPEALVEGREQTYFAYFWNDLAADGTHSLSNPTVRPMLPLIPVPDGCGRGGHILRPGQTRQRNSPRWLKLG